MTEVYPKFHRDFNFLDQVGQELELSLIKTQCKDEWSGSQRAVSSLVVIRTKLQQPQKQKTPTATKFLILSAMQMHQYPQNDSFDSTERRTLT